ncbi:hypothetical protein ILYODFUR_017438, partial [Ilyodon furcidens]
KYLRYYNHTQILILPTIPKSCSVFFLEVSQSRNYGIQEHNIIPAQLLGPTNGKSTNRKEASRGFKEDFKVRIRMWKISVTLNAALLLCQRPSETADPLGFSSKTINWFNKEWLKKVYVKSCLVDENALLKRQTSSR